MGFKLSLGFFDRSAHQHSAASPRGFSTNLKSDNAREFDDAISEILRLRHADSLSAEQKAAARQRLEENLAAEYEGGAFYVLLGAKVLLEEERALRGFVVAKPDNRQPIPL